MQPINRVMVTGGAGYVGAVLVPKLLNEGYFVRVLDLYMYGDSVLDSVKDHPNLEQVKGDIRDRPTLERTLAGCDAVIHLACISNDPSFELNPDLGMLTYASLDPYGHQLMQDFRAELLLRYQDFITAWVIGVNLIV